MGIHLLWFSPAAMQSNSGLSYTPTHRTHEVISCQLINKFKFSSFPNLSCVHERTAGRLHLQHMQCLPPAAERSPNTEVWGGCCPHSRSASKTFPPKGRHHTRHVEAASTFLWRTALCGTQASVRDTFAGRTSFYEPEELQL